MRKWIRTNYAASTSIKYKQQRMRMAHKITQQYIKVLAKLFLLYVYYDRIQNAIHLEISPMYQVPRQSTGKSQKIILFTPHVRGCVVPWRVTVIITVNRMLTSLATFRAVGQRSRLVPAVVLAKSHHVTNT